MKPGTMIYDRWWPWRLGRVLRSARGVLVRWSDGERWHYDRAHAKFLNPCNREVRE